MVEDYVQLPVDSTGKKLRTYKHILHRRHRKSIGIVERLFISMKSLKLKS